MARRVLNNRKNKPITLHGVAYPSQKAAAQALGVKKGGIWCLAQVAADPDFYKKVYARQAENRRRYALKKARENLPTPTRPCPTRCEVVDCHRKAICLDHDHLTGEFRGWLCQPCNRAASKHHTSAQLHALANYLERHGG